MPVLEENRTILKSADGRQIVIPEQSTHRITMLLVDETGAAIPLAALQTAVLTIYAKDESGLTIVNADGPNIPDHADIKNVGRGTIHATSGLLTLVLFPTDNEIVNTANDLEWHRLLIEVGYNSTQKLKYEIDVPVRNLHKVT